MTLLLTVAGAILVATLRSHWVSHHFTRHVIVTTYWALATKQGAVTLDEAIQIWPRFNLYLELWNWDWNRYVTYQHHHEEMEEWIAIQLKREKLDLSELLGTDLSSHFSTTPPPADEGEDHSRN